MRKNAEVKEEKLHDLSLKKLVIIRKEPNVNFCN